MKRSLLTFPLQVLLIISFLLTACGSPESPDAAVDPTRLFQDALLTATYSVSTPVPVITKEAPDETSSPQTDTKPIAQRTPPQLPPPFASEFIKPLDKPHQYIQDRCDYLKQKWDPDNATPGTVVMPIMFHSITDGDVTYADQISVDEFNLLMKNLKDQGFEAITIRELVNFLENNASIPQRSVLLIVDDRKRKEYFETHFKPYYDEFGWKVTNAWISTNLTSEELWQENIDVENAGYVDHQAHGVIHNEPITGMSTDEYIRSEIFGSSAIIEERYGKKPVAYIWPGGGFTKKAVEVARQAGYRLGFTVNPRGPLMFNWIPLANEADPARPSYIPEGLVEDPLMVLPRYWDTDASYHIDTVRQIGKAAIEYEKQNKAIELEYIDLACPE